MNENEPYISTRQAVINGLAIVGFVILVGAGIWLAVYSTRYVPTVVNRVGAAAVYLGSIFTPASEPTLLVVPTASSTIISFGEASSTTSTNTTVSKPVTSTQQKPIPTAGRQTNTTQQISGATTATLSGLPDFVATINAVGYLTTMSADSFVASTSVLIGSAPSPFHY